MANLEKKLFITSLCAVIFFNCCVCNAEPIKPQINKNTQIITKYGCERPRQWQEKERTLKINNEEVKCYINTRDYVLYNYSVTMPVIEVKNCKKNKLCCKLTGGEWIVKDLNNKNTHITEKNQIHIDHVLPFNYIRLNMKNCKDTTKYYNYMNNLKPELAKLNTKKSDNLCETKEECELQHVICKMMSTEFNDNSLCDELEQVIGETQK